jgi:hypothetical protein
MSENPKGAKEHWGAMEHWLDRYRGCDVEIVYLTDTVFKDRGHLSDFGDGWIELHRPTNDTFLVPTTAIRLVKVLGPPAEPASLLLRPSSPGGDEERE